MFCNKLSSMLGFRIHLAMRELYTVGRWDGNICGNEADVNVTTDSAMQCSTMYGLFCRC